jgi:YfiH family protein
MPAAAQHVFTTKQPRLPPSGNDVWNHLEANFAANAAQFLRIKQVHGRQIRVVRRTELDDHAAAARPEADAVISDAPGAVLAVQVADCVPLLVFDSRTGAAGAIHAGWRGTAAGIASATVEALSSQFDCRPRDLIVAVGPSIGTCCYQVGDDVRNAFRKSGATEQQLSQWFVANAAGALALDLWAANRDQLVASGVLLEHVHVCGLCTQTHSHLFESYRADGTRAGRMIAAIKVPNV